MVFNEAFWIEQQLNHIYEIFDEIIICDGAERKHNSGHGISNPPPSGKSTDNLNVILDKFDDYQNKIKYIPYGLCNDKVEMCNEMYSKSSSEYIWEIDADEFYHITTMKEILELLKTTNINQINFPLLHFIDFNHIIAHNNTNKWGADGNVRRIFKHEPNNKFISHRPPTINYKSNGKIITGNESKTKNWLLYHYSYVFDWQRQRKATFYPNGNKVHTDIKSWMHDHTKKINNSSTEPFIGNHPIDISQLTDSELPAS